MVSKEFIRVLLVEDDEDDFLIIRDLLADIQDSSYIITWVDTIEKALQIIEQEPFDISLVDYRLGQMTGLDLIQEIKRGNNGFPIILLTGIGDREVDMAAMQAGAADFLMKGQLDARILERTIRYAIEHNHIVKSLNELTILDELTGLYNRREMKRLMDQELERFKRNGHPFSVIMLDIDHFKPVNDTYGHLTGDQVLKQLAILLKNRVRIIDQCARYGGEEFVIILPETSKERAAIVAESIREIVAQSRFNCNQECGNQVQIEISISLGVAELPSDGMCNQAILAAADRVLYKAKKRGRNQVVVSGENMNAFNCQIPWEFFHPPLGG
jgi:diguanylate cyclase (GGDEF)-like protein